MYGEEGLSLNPNKMINPKKKIFEQIKSIKTCTQKLTFTGELAIGPQKLIDNGSRKLGILGWFDDQINQLLHQSSPFLLYELYILGQYIYEVFLKRIN